MDAPTAAVPFGAGRVDVCLAVVPTATSYVLERSFGSGWTVVHDSGDTFWSAIGPLTLQRFRARACNAHGCGPYSAELIVEPEEEGPFVFTPPNPGGLPPWPSLVAAPHATQTMARVGGAL